MHLEARPSFRRSSLGDLLILAGIAGLVFSAGLGLRDPWPADEPRFVLIAQEMVESGSWFFPRRAGELYPDKPPLFLWAVGTAYRVTGSWRIAFLLPSLISGLGILVLVYDLGRRLWHRRAGFASGLALLATIQFSLQAKTAQIDASVTFFTTLGLYGLVRHCLLGPSWRWWWIAFGAMGFGVLTKGVGLLPLLALIPWSIGRHFHWPGIPRIRGCFLFWALGPLILVAVIGIWLVPMLLLVARSGEPALVAYRDNILWGQTAVRYVAYPGHQKPVWYYFLQVIPILWLPCSLLLPWLLPAWVRRLGRKDGRYLFLLGWIVAVVLFFSFGSGKRGVYIVPAVPALALSVGPLLAAGVDRGTGPRGAFLGLLWLLTGSFLVLAAGSAAGSIQPAPELGRDLEITALLSTLSFLGLITLVAWRFRDIQKRGAFALTLVFFVALWQVVGWWIWPLWNGQRSSKDLMEVVQRNLEPGTDLAMVGWREQMILQSDRPVTHWGYSAANERSESSEAQMEAAASWLAARPVAERAAIVPEGWLSPCFENGSGIFLGRSHRLALRLVDAADLSSACYPGPGRALPIYRSFSDSTPRSRSGE